MKKFLMFLCTLTLVFGFAGSASALTYTDTFDAGGIYMEDGHWVSTGWFKGYCVDDDTISWTFDITDNGFNPDSQDVTSASVLLSLADDYNGCFNIFGEYAELNVGDNTFNWEVDTGNVSFSLLALMTLSDTGTINATLTATGGDFIFNSATLTAQGTQPVPEPATILLMGIGLFGIVGIRRRMNLKN